MGRLEQLKYRLWRDQNERCLYSDKPISMTELFSAEVEVDHILPYSRTVDDSYMNKALVMASENRFKGNRTPYEAYGGHPERWERLAQCARHLPPAEHLARHRAADLFLDTWPCNAHTTASDALWAGVPVVTFAGETFASRVAASLVHAVGLGDLVCRDIEHYAHTVVELAYDPERLAHARQTLVPARDTSPLFDSRRFTQDIEALYLRMMQRHVDGLPPAPLPAAPAETPLPAAS